MVWGKEKSSSSPSTIKQLLPLFVTLVFLSVLAWVCYQIYVSLYKIQAQARKQMGDNNVVFSRDGVRVNVQDVGNESYLDATQSWVVKAWSLGTTSDEKAKRKRYASLGERA
ncbi:hypothetical protein MFIFM68171_07491 [Madurella fahalii]|uniref:ATP synthase F0 subunit 8 n=1 Tax=Madurella fahalii TaxID=1157608 RepID=A0ABQ0GHN9_9PEZI